nr:uncharacterized protein K02A2.6-like [Coffea arabica]
MDTDSSDTYISHHLVKALELPYLVTTPFTVVIRDGSMISGCTKSSKYISGNSKEKSDAETPIEVKELLDKYKDVFAAPTGLPPERSLDHAIPLKSDAQAFKIKPYRCPHSQKTEIEKQVVEMLDNGIIKHSNSPYASPVLLVKRKMDKYPIPNIEELIAELCGSKYHSKIDLRPGYAFGLTNAPATFQALMNQVFQPYLRKFVLIFFDDILVYSKDLDQHVKHLEVVLEVLRENQLYAKLSKCSFAQQKIEYLGPLTDLLKKDSFCWDEQADAAFKKLKQIMRTSLVLRLPDFERPFVIETDASNGGIGAVLQQDSHPIAYLSRALSTRNLGLSIYENELMALVLAYKKGSDNTTVDALSRKAFCGQEDQQENSFLAISAVKPKWMEELCRSYEGDEHWSSLLKAVHDIAQGGHSGQRGTYQKLKALFYWEGMKQDVIKFVSTCDVCQRCKHENVPYPGLLQALTILDKAWSHLTMDFIEKLPMSQGMDTIMVVIDRFTKYAHFLVLKHPFTAIQVAQLFLDNVYKLHGLPVSIVSDKDKIFTSKFWQELFRLMGAALHLSSSYHPQIDGHSERLNQCLENFLRCMSSEHPTHWYKWLPLAELWYNTTFHSGLQITPFEVFYGYKPSCLPLGPYQDTIIPGAKDLVQERI